jgi:hypothetical protein
MINLFWFSRPHLGRDNVTNFGDELSKFIVEGVSGQKVQWINPLKQSFFQRNFRKHYLAVGSVLHFGANNSRIWGSGLLDTSYSAPNGKYYAVRGKYTRQELQKRGYKVPEVYGDPGLLAPLYYNNKNVTKKYILGVIPHYFETEEIIEQAKNLNLTDEVKIINLRNDIEPVLDDILSCEHIISSSLHGIIVPHAYEIPTLRVEFSDKIIGDGIKYMDYFDSVGIDHYEPPFIDWTKFDTNSVLDYFKKMHSSLLITKDLGNIQRELLNASPF